MIPIAHTEVRGHPIFILSFLLHPLASFYSNQLREGVVVEHPFLFLKDTITPLDHVLYKATDADGAIHKQRRVNLIPPALLVLEYPSNGWAVGSDSRE